MHVITGGAFNGKRKWVKENYYLNKKQNIVWFNAYEEEALPITFNEQSTTVVVEGVEQLIFRWMNEINMDDAREFGRDIIRKWLKWENQVKNRTVIVICTDLSKGIVPMDRKLRKWRDLTGWFYQDLVEQSSEVYLIWYGIAKKLK